MRVGIIPVIASDVGLRVALAHASSYDRYLARFVLRRSSCPVRVLSLMWIVLGAVVIASAADSEDSQVVENSLGMRFVRFEDPPRHVFYLGMHEVTQHQYERVMHANPSLFAPGKLLAERVAGLDSGKLPVDSVSWYEANEFCRQLSSLPVEMAERRTYRLPTANEWDFGCRGDSRDRWSFGNDGKRLSRYAWYEDNSDRRTHFVGEKEPNRSGLFDMHGNVWEWCRDADPRSSGQVDASRIIRGGGWASAPLRCSCSYVIADPPVVKDPDTGFRVVLELSAKRMK